jgi:hypothetical protein
VFRQCSRPVQRETIKSKNPGKIRICKAALIALLAGTGLSSEGDLIVSNKETFHAEYSGSADNVSNDVVNAAGRTNVVLLHQTTAAYEINPVTEKNEGLAVGKSHASLSYETADNLPAAAGSIEAWFKPIDWNPSANTFNMIFQTATGGATPPAKLLIYKASLSGVGAYFRINDASPEIRLFQSITNWQNHIYHHIVFTYDATGDAVLFVDGVEIDREALGTASNPAVISWPSAFTVGPWSSGFGNTDGQTAIERVRIYNTALTADEVQYLAARTEFNQVLGAFSKWFLTGRPKLGLAALDKDTVPPPWTNVTYTATNSTAACWNRNYIFSGNSILENVISGTNALISGPLALSMTVAGESGYLELGTPEVEMEASGAGRLVFNRTGAFLDSAATLRCTLEYDGLLWCDLKITVPTNKALEKLTLETFFEKDAAQLTHYVGAPTNYTSQNVPKNSYSKTIPYSEGRHHTSGLKTMVWIGNNQYGLLWCTESDQYWWPKNSDDCISMTRIADGRVAFDVNMVAGALPTNAPQTLSYRFGLMATPIKELPSGWRSWNHTDQLSGRTGDRRGKNVIYWPYYRFMLMDHDPTRYPADQIASNKWLIYTRDIPEKRAVIPYWTRTNILDENEEGRSSLNDTNRVTKILREASLMTREWGNIPNLPAGSRQHRLSASTEWSDYLVWNLEEFATNVMGHADGMYMDEVQPIPNARSESNGGYDDFDGTRRPTFEMFGTRNLLKRLAYNTWQRNHERPRAIAHCSATQTANSLSAFDLWLIGEQYNPGYFWQNPELLPPADNPVEEIYYYSYVLPMDRVRTECYPQQWGQVMVWLPQLKDHPKAIWTNAITARDMLSRVMQADMVIWPLWCNDGEVYKTWAFRKDFDIGDANIRFHPYWEQTLITASDATDGIDSDIVAGYYSKPSGEYLVLLSNLSRKSRTVEVDFGNLSVASVTDAETKTDLPLNAAGTLVLEMNRNDYRALRVDTAKNSSFLFSIISAK